MYGEKVRREVGEDKGKRLGGSKGEGRAAKAGGDNGGPLFIHALVVAEVVGEVVGGVHGGGGVLRRPGRQGQADHLLGGVH